MGQIANSSGAVSVTLACHAELSPTAVTLTSRRYRVAAAGGGGGSCFTHVCDAPSIHQSKEKILEMFEASAA